MKLTQSLALLSAMPLLGAVCGRLEGNSEPAGGQGIGPNADGSCGPQNNPVCVDGEVTYQNPCLAEAQGETKYANGPCEGKDVLFQGDAAATGEEMDRFKDENFKLVGRVGNSDHGGEPLEAVERRGDDLPGADAPGQSKRLARVTPDGLMYVARDYTPGAPFDTIPASQNDDVPGMRPDLEEEAPARKSLFGGRKLQIGTDTRSKIESTSVWPYWRLGEVDWSSEGGCSGSIVGANKVLLAAHCVYNTVSNQWQVPSAFAPGRYGRKVCPWYYFGGCYQDTVEPWGTWPVQYATIPTAWINHDPCAECGGCNSNSICASSSGVGVDVAILTMGTNWAGNIGSHMGTLPIITSPCSINSDSTTTGYPASKANGEMWTSGRCESWNSGCTSDRIIRNTCDISPGHSGSAVYDNIERVFGVVSASGSSTSFFFGFNDVWRNAVLTW